MFSWNNNLRNFFAGGTRSREAADTLALFSRVRGLYTSSIYAEQDRNEYITSLVMEACDRAELIPTTPLLMAMGGLVEGLLFYDYLLFGFPVDPKFDALTTEESVALRTFLVRKERFLMDHERQADIWREKVIRILEGILKYFPTTAFKDSWGEDEPDEGLPGASVPLIDLCETPAEVIERTMITFFDDDVTKAELFTSLREQLDRRACFASGIDWTERHTTKRKIELPTHRKESQPSRLVELYLEGTPWKEFFLAKLPFYIPFPARFEHTHIIGGSGHGKTQLLQLSIVRDLVESAADGRSVVVMDSQGDLLRTISHLSLFSPDFADGFADRVMLIDPADVEFPVALNMFDFKQEQIASLPLVERERVLNGTIELYEYFFGALLGAELTAKQGIIFKYLARLLLEIPDATIHTFRNLMEDGEPFRPYMEKLPPTARAFFETRFFDRSFNETKKQVLTRLWGVLSNATFDRMFSHPRSKVDMFAALQEGRIVLINTAKDLLKDEGASILGRFFIALIAQAAMRRATLPAHARRPCFVYIDEAADYFDDKIGSLLNQARKYKVGMVLAHQNLDQLTPALRASISSSTSIKLVGGVSNKDASALASEMHTDTDFVLAQKKRKKETFFACYVRNVTPQALSLSIPLGAVEELPAMDEEEFSSLRDANRERIAVPLEEVPAPPPPPRAEPRPFPPRPQAKSQEMPEPKAVAPTLQPLPDQPPVVRPAVSPKEEMVQPPIQRKEPVKRKERMPVEPPPLGRGGQEHKYLQNLIKEFAITKGYRAVIEEEILDGAGRVDVALTKGDLRVACEISVTTGRDQELGNIEKCLGAGFNHVILVSTDARYLKSMEQLCADRFEDDAAKVRFKSPQDALALIEQLAGVGATETTVRGYKVKLRQAPISTEEAERRRATVAEVIARSMRKRTSD